MIEIWEWFGQQLFLGLRIVFNLIFIFRVSFIYEFYHLSSFDLNFRLLAVEDKFYTNRDQWPRLILNQYISRATIAGTHSDSSDVEASDVSSFVIMTVVISIFLHLSGVIVFKEVFLNWHKSHHHLFVNCGIWIDWLEIVSYFLLNLCFFFLGYELALRDYTQIRVRTVEKQDSSTTVEHGTYFVLDSRTVFCYLTDRTH